LPSPSATPPASQEKRKSEEDLAKRLIQVVRDLALELHPRLTRQVAVELDSNLDRDLALDSLGRAELLLRLDRTFKVRLPDHLIGDAETPRDLLEAVLAASPAMRAAGARATVEPILLPETAAPTRARTLIEALADHTRYHGERPHIRLWRSEEEEEQISYAELEQSSRVVAFGLLEQGLNAGDRVAIMLRTGKDYFFSFFGVLAAGGIPVPIYPPFRRAQVEDHLRRQAGILKNAEASFLITEEEIRNVGVLLYGLVEALRRVSTVSELSGAGSLTEALQAQSDTTALIQYTSGSTGDPKGVVLSHANLLANIRAMGQVMEANSSDRLVSWLPLYHDMGLIGAWLGCLYYGASLTIMPPLAFLADPARWLWAIHKHRATLSAAPNFAYELCLKNIRDTDIEGLDLSSLRMVVNGAEPVSPATIRRFTDKFQKFGFRAQALAPVYGLAESSVGLAFPPVGRAPIIDRVDRNALSGDGIARQAEPGDLAALEFVACGQPLPDHEVRIVDVNGREVPDRNQGRLQFKGPSCTKEYFNNPEKTRTLFDGEWLESGDLAYIADGDIFITGRVKDIIIRAGRNIYPHELEELIGTVEGVRKGCVAAFPSPDLRTGSERLIVIAETRLTDPAALKRLRSEIMDASMALLEMPPDDVVLAPPHTVPKTSSGKLRRSEARAIYETGAIGRRSSALWWQLARLTMAGLGTRLRRAGRTANELAYAAYWWALLCSIAVVTWLLVIALPRRRWRHNVIHYAARSFLSLTCSSFDVEISEPVPKERTILAVNHSSYLDGVVLCAAIPGELTFVAKEELEGQWVAGQFLRRLGTIFVRRTDPKGGVEDTAEILKSAQSGKRLVSFPEGTLTRMPGVLAFHMGTFLVAAQARMDVIPTTIRGTRSILRGGQWFPRRGSVSLHLGTPIHPTGDDFEAAVHLRDAVRGKILAESREPDLAGESVVL
jgi:1-acyl-sn-glycerol-3-phosphate acyltransferase